MSKQNILFVSKKFLLQPFGGREMLSSLNYKLLRNIFNQNCFHFEISSNQSHSNKLKLFSKIFQGEIDGVSEEVLAKLSLQVRLQNISQIFVDGSNLGLVAQNLKKEFPNIKIFTFFHNVETKFFYDSLARAKSLRSIIILVANYFAERKSVKYSDHLICLTKTDSNILSNLFNRNADSILPMALADKLDGHASSINEKAEEKYVLFVGGLFYANEHGVRWFVRHIAPNISYKILIVGRGFEVFKNEFEKTKNITVAGEVDDLNKWYRESDCVIAPIFEGSGMKTKVAEALMFGKKIVASSAALDGYEGIPNNICYSCNSKAAFIETLNSLFSEQHLKFDQRIRDIYENNFSFSAAEKNLKKILFS